MVLLNEKNEMAVLIPLSERAITIELDYREINETNKIIKKFYLSK